MYEGEASCESRVTRFDGFDDASAAASVITYTLHNISQTRVSSNSRRGLQIVRNVNVVMRNETDRILT